MGRGRSYLKCFGIVSSSLWIASPVWAQSPVAAEAGAGGGLEEIVVTAQRREESLQNVPIAVSAISGEMAVRQGVIGIESLTTVVPGLVISRQANQAQPYLRGLGSASGSPNAEPSVAIYVDGVYSPSANGNYFDFNNIERIEVLKGPQGTLFGRNATGGVIQVITKDPTQQPEGDFELGYGNYETVTAKGYLSGPLTDNLAGNIAVLYKKQNQGWGTNIATGEDTPGVDNLGIRGKLLYSVGTTDIKLAGYYNHNRDGAINGQNPPGTSTLNFPLLVTTGTGDPFPGEYNTNNNFEQKSDIESTGGALTITHDFKAFQFKSITAYSETEGFWQFDQDLSPWQGLDAVPNQESRMFTQELQLIAPADATFQWLVGAFYYDYKAANAREELNGELLDPTFPVCVFTGSCNGQSGFDLDDSTKSTSYAVFAQGTYPILENTNLTVGARYTWDEVDFNGSTLFHGTDIVVPVPGFGPVSGNFKNDDPTYRIALDHRFTDDIMGYLSYNRGMKAGGFDLSAVVMQLNVDNAFDPEKVDAYEVGVKTELLDDKVRLNVGGFYYDFSNMQFQKIVTGNGITFNAPNGAEMYGVELELLAQATDNLLINASLAWLDTTIRDFPGAPNTCPLPNGLNDSGGFFCDDPTKPYNAKGNNTPNSPEISGTIGAVYTIASSVGSFELSANTYYTDTNYFEIDNRTHNDPYWLFNASVLWTQLNDKLTFRVWGRNLSDEYYYTQYTGQGGASDVAGPAAPREYGVTIGYRF